MLEPPRLDKPVRDLDVLLEPFYRAEKPRAAWRVGTEAEKFGVLAESGAPLPMHGARSVTRVLQELAARFDWEPIREVEGGAIVALGRGETSITLEPGGQVELSGSPTATIHETCAEFRTHLHELDEISQPLGIRWLGLGFHPFATQRDLPWVPKLRYGIMREYLPTRGSGGLDMMRRTCTVQTNLDYESEQDAVRKLRLCLRAQPITTAMFANSPWAEQRRTGERSHRASVWLKMDPDRSGLLPFAWTDSMSYRSYVEWALDVPMFLIKRDNQVLPATTRTFRSFLRDGLKGHTATYGDWLIHLNTLFPEARLKNTIEIRGADAQRKTLTCALPAFWRGLLYSPRAFARAETLTERLSFEQVEQCRPDVANHALRAQLAGRPVAEWATALLSIALDGLGELAERRADGADERIHLKQLTALVEAGRCPADDLLDEVAEGPDFRRRLLEYADVMRP